MLNNGKNINPKNQSELITFMSDYIDSPNKIPKKELLASAKQASVSQHQGVRKSVIKLYCKLYEHFGDSIKDATKDLNPNFKKVLDVELARITVASQSSVIDLGGNKFSVGNKASVGPNGSIKNSVYGKDDTNPNGMMLED